VHDFPDAAEHDERRDRYMADIGLKIVRSAASDVFRDPDAVADALVRMCTDGAGPSTTQLR
jgi:very-short-patch-repair endonuclease